MKKIGIITYHRAYNYGSALQAYALNKYLRKRGFLVETIDFRTERQDKLYEIFESNKNIMCIARNMQSLIYYKKLKTHKKSFEKFWSNYIAITSNSYTAYKELEDLNEEYDYFICGSDQIWNPNCLDFDPVYMLSFVKDKKKCISYAPSMGISHLEKEQEKIFKKNILNFKALSIREKQGGEVIKGVIGQELEVVLDPTFLLDENEWKEISITPNIKDPYIFCYFIGDVDGMRDFAKKMRKETGLKVVVVYKNLRDMLQKTTKKYESGPREFLGLIKNAEYICTNSFHAVVFSIIFKKRFWVFIEDQNKNLPQTRIYNIAEKFKLENRILSKNNCNVSIDENINYKEVEKILNKEKEKSYDYIERALN